MAPLEKTIIWRVLRKIGMFKKYLLHDKLLTRFSALLGLVVVAFLAAWTLSYLLLPEGMLRGRSVAQLLAGSELTGGSVWLEWIRLLAINLGVVVLAIIAPNIFRTENNYPLGYTSTTLIAMIFGVTLGTNSFAVSLGGKMMPTLAVLGSSGLYEIAAYVLAAAATVSISRVRLVGKWPKQTIETITPPQAKSVFQEQFIGILLSIVILGIACGWEAYRFAQAISQ